MKLLLGLICATILLLGAQFGPFGLLCAVLTLLCHRWLLFPLRAWWRWRLELRAKLRAKAKRVAYNKRVAQQQRARAATRMSLSSSHRHRQLCELFSRSECGHMMPLLGDEDTRTATRLRGEGPSQELLGY